MLDATSEKTVKLINESNFLLDDIFKELDTGEPDDLNLLYINTYLQVILDCLTNVKRNMKE